LIALWAKLDAMWNGWKVEPKSGVGGRIAGISPVSSPVDGSCSRYRQTCPQLRRGSSSAKTMTLSRGTTISPRLGRRISPAVIHSVVDIEIGRLVPVARDVHAGAGADCVERQRVVGFSRHGPLTSVGIVARQARPVSGVGTAARGPQYRRSLKQEIRSVFVRY
jgi:hypothetical protein